MAGILLRSPERSHVEVAGLFLSPLRACFLKKIPPHDRLLDADYTPGRPHHQDGDAGRTQNPVGYAPPYPAADP
jgi:hypothetical protein